MLVWNECNCKGTFGKTNKNQWKHEILRRRERERDWIEGKRRDCRVGNVVICKMAKKKPTPKVLSVWQQCQATKCIAVPFPCPGL